MESESKTYRWFWKTVFAQIWGFMDRQMFYYLAMQQATQKLSDLSNKRLLTHEFGQLGLGLAGFCHVSMINWQVSTGLAGPGWPYSHACWSGYLMGNTESLFLFASRISWACFHGSDRFTGGKGTILVPRNSLVETRHRTIQIQVKKKETESS
jgi:hypothetical protein